MGKQLTIKNIDYKYIDKFTKGKCIILLNMLKSKYRDMKARCYCETNKDYRNYGGRGIKICKEWLENKESFIYWGLDNINDFNKTSIDRINGDGDYEPNNCRFVSSSFNTRWQGHIEREKYNYSSVNLYFKANKKIEYETIKARIKMGWKEEDIINRAIQKKTMTLKLFQFFIEQNTCLEKLEKLYNRFLEDNNDPEIIKQGNILYNEYKQKGNSGYKLQYLEKREV